MNFIAILYIINEGSVIYEKIAINTCFGGFSLSREAILKARKLSNNPEWGGDCIRGDVNRYGETLLIDFGSAKVDRDDKFLIEVIQEMGDDASSEYSKLKVVEIPEDAEVKIVEDFGKEKIKEIHRVWT